MCTVSWLPTPSGYHVFFNRDEQKTRAKALPPSIIEDGETAAIMPIDPQGDGTWCATNAFGLTFALLNFYQGRLPKGRLISRGKLVRNCAQFATVEEAVAYISGLELMKYAPFSLLCFSAERVGNTVKMLRWTGKKLETLEQASPLISSAVNFEEVQASRLDVYHEMITRQPASMLNEDHFIRLHASHKPNRSAMSLCMHREDAHTVSFSHIEVTDTHIRYRYSDGAPCENAIIETAVLERAEVFA